MSNFVKYLTLNFINFVNIQKYMRPASGDHIGLESEHLESDQDRGVRASELVSFDPMGGELDLANLKLPR